MRKLFIIALALSFVFCGGQAFATYDDAQSDNVVDFTGFGGAKGTTPPTKVVLVRYAYSSPDALGLKSGDSVIWDVTSADGFTISACVTTTDATWAGVLVTDIATSDNNTVRSTGRNTGWMCVEGYCLADVAFTAEGVAAVAGDHLVTAGTPKRRKLKTATDPATSDVGVLLRIPAGDENTTGITLCPVWLK